MTSGQYLFYFYFLPKIILRIIAPSFLSIPVFDVGTPVFLAKLCFAPDMPKSLFQEKENPNLPIFNYSFKQQYLIQMVVVAIH